MVEHHFPVRYADTDGAGHVFFANYLIYADEGYTAYLNAIDCSYRELESLGVYMVFAHTECNHRGSARHGDTITVHTRIPRVGRTSLTVEARVLRGEELLAEVQLVSVCMSHGTRTPVEVPERLRTAIAAREA